jgi:hypothetical protein
MFLREGMEAERFEAWLHGNMHRSYASMSNYSNLSLSLSTSDNGTSNGAGSAGVRKIGTSGRGATQSYGSVFHGKLCVFGHVVYAVAACMSWQGYCQVYILLGAVSAAALSFHRSLCV